MADYRQAARRIAQKYGLDPDIFERQIERESNFNPRAVSPAGARGIAQIMPATARAWGVNPDDPIQALNAAASHMAGYVRKYGAEGALRAYNAGEGAVEKSKSYAETNGYVKAILGNQRPVTTVAAAVSGPQAAVNETRATGRGKLIADFVAGDIKDPLDFALDIRAARGDKAPSQTPDMQAGPTGATTAGTDRLLELFWQGPGGLNVKNGKPVPQGFVTGHADHVHVATGLKDAVRLGKIAQQMGLTVRENEAFDPVDPVHAKNSYHYRNQAIDVSGDPRRLARFARRVARRYGVK